MPAYLLSPRLLPITLLITSNVFMTAAWYGICASSESPSLRWFCQLADCWGSAVYSPAQLKTMQEVITLAVFAAFSVLYLREPFTWNYTVGFLLIGAGAYFILVGPFAR